ncbi:ribosomal protein L7Ae family protein [Clostridium sp. N3C]|uniref:ribosomal L7Ae/L30e/S12e/Gadd45 family protein n=1 Tax=Clostridium sp. N3C TaxID=1776758 RepID=UPI00092DFF08|nr:ribosomal L7Ae/L30e/S12e/Gadd45 family protein [Clostridium sp. N3C]SCN21914.1 ribosomal protein L7Ae family protein [Clostridium sp. N3C]
MKDNFLQFLALTKGAGKLIEGYNKCEEKIKHGKVFLCILSKSLSENSYKKFKNLCEKKNIKYIYDYDKEELGSILGRKEINVLGVIDSNMSTRLMEIYNANQNNRG